MNFRRRIPVLLPAFTALALIAACNHHSGGSDVRQGNVRVMLTAGSATTLMSRTGASPTAPASTVLNDGSMTGSDLLSRLQNVNVTFSSLLARNMDGDLIDLKIDLPKTVDLLSLMNGNQVSLPAGTLPAGTYDQLVVVITHVEFVFQDGTKIELTPPGGGWTKIIPVTPFEVADGQTTTITLRFNPMNAFGESGGEFQFFPDFDCSAD